MISEAMGAALDAYERAAVRWGEEKRGMVAMIQARAAVVRLIEAELAAARMPKP